MTLRVLVRPNLVRAPATSEPRLTFSAWLDRKPRNMGTETERLHMVKEDVDEDVAREAARARASERNMVQWTEWYIPGTEVDGWLFGWCIIHDDVHDTDKPTAQFNFFNSTMRCLTRADACHPGKRSVSLQNAAVARVTNGAA